MEKYFLNLRPFLVLRKLKIEYDPLSLFSSDKHSDYSDFTYEYEDEEDGVFQKKSTDGYEINIFSVAEESLDYDQCGMTSGKKFIDAHFLGNRNEGDIGYLFDEMTSNGVITTCHFSQEVYNEFYPKIYNYYNSQKYNKQVGDLMLEFLIRTNRDKQIEKII